MLRSPYALLLSTPFLLCRVAFAVPLTSAWSSCLGAWLHSVIVAVPSASRMFLPMPGYGKTKLLTFVLELLMSMVYPLHRCLLPFRPFLRVFVMASLAPPLLGLVLCPWTPRFSGLMLMMPMNPLLYTVHLQPPLPHLPAPLCLCSPPTSSPLMAKTMPVTPGCPSHLVRHAAPRQARLNCVCSRRPVTASLPKAHWLLPCCRWGQRVRQWWRRMLYLP